MHQIVDCLVLLRLAMPGLQSLIHVCSAALSYDAFPKIPTPLHWMEAGRTVTFGSSSLTIASGAVLFDLFSSGTGRQKNRSVRCHFADAPVSHPQASQRVERRSNRGDRMVMLRVVFGGHRAE
ncbi:hypothetical protein DFJ74DRAFT_689262 [Hyaloraphidium curvatum]|nr:hypothetical protein DFJ74DRAFT_689262 [Hyaloraphidium curvatum]